MLQESELSAQADSENNLGGSSETMYFIGLDVIVRTSASRSSQCALSWARPRTRVFLLTLTYMDVANSVSKEVVVIM